MQCCICLVSITEITACYHGYVFEFLPYLQCYAWFMTNCRNTEINQPWMMSDFFMSNNPHWFCGALHSKPETRSVSQSDKKKNKKRNAVASHCNPIVFLVKSSANISTLPSTKPPQPQRSHTLSLSLLQK